MKHLLLIKCRQNSFGKGLRVYVLTSAIHKQSKLISHQMSSWDLFLFYVNVNVDKFIVPHNMGLKCPIIYKIIT